MARLDPIPPERMTAEQREAYEAGAAAGRPVWLGPHIAYIRNPRHWALHLQAMANLFSEKPLSVRLRQLVVMRTIRQWGADFAWETQRQWSLDAGIDAAIVDAIERGETPPLTAPEEIAAYRFCSELLEHNRVDDATYANALELLGEEVLVTIVIAMGMISTTSMTCNAFEIAY